MKLEKVLNVLITIVWAMAFYASIAFFIVVIIPSVFPEDDSLLDQVFTRTISGAATISIFMNYLILVLFLVWLYRSYSHAYLSYSKKMKFSPGFAVAWFLIPFLNILMPLFVMRDLWLTSFKAQPQQLAGKPKTGLITIWWVCWLLMFGSLSSPFLGISDSVPEVAMLFGMAGFFFFYAAQYFFLNKVIKKIGAQQRKSLSASNQEKIGLQV